MEIYSHISFSLSEATFVTTESCFLVALKKKKNNNLLSFIKYVDCGCFTSLRSGGELNLWEFHP